MNLSRSGRAAFFRLPRSIRVLFVIGFVVLATLSLVFPVPLGVLAGLTAAFLVCGVLRVSGTRLFLVLILAMPLVVGYALSGFDWSHPFFGRYLRGAFYVVSVGLLTDALRLEEWVAILRPSSHDSFSYSARKALLASILAIAVGRVSLPQAIDEERSARKDARVSSWSKRPFLSRLLDYLAIPLRTLFETIDPLEVAIRTWREPRLSHNTLPPPTEPSAGLPFFANSSHICTLSDVYDFPGFPQALAKVFPVNGVSSTWRKRLEKLPRGLTVLEVGAGSGRLTTHLLDQGLAVHAVERQEHFFRQLSSLAAQRRNLMPILGSFPNVSLSSYSSVLLHQNVFLELLNQMGIRHALRALRGVLAPKGLILLDYPGSFAPATDGVLIDAFVEDLGHVRYCFAYRGTELTKHRATLFYQVVGGRQATLVHAPLAFELPEISTIVSEAETLGFTPMVKPLQGGISFFADSMNLLELSLPE